LLTFTVSRIETAIAIIATCLPALRSMILGRNNTSNGGASSSNGGGHYELSSARRKANGNRINASNNPNETSEGFRSTHDTRSRANGSEDSLFTDPPSTGMEQYVGGKGTAVNTQIETMFEESRNTSSASSEAQSPFQ
jgi:hypothetical protein